MRLAAPAVPKEWRFDRHVDGSARLVIARQTRGWSAFLTILLLICLVVVRTGLWRWPLLWWIQLAPICLLVVQLADCLKHRAFDREVWRLSSLGLNIRHVTFGFTWQNVDYQRGSLAVDSAEGMGWALQFHNGAAYYPLHQSQDLDELLGLAAFMEAELNWPLRAPTASPFLFRQFLEDALAKQDRERVRLLLQDARSIPILMQAWKEWDPVFRPRLRVILLELELETGCLSRLAGEIGSEAQAGAVELLGELGSAHACPVLRSALAISAGSVRALAARALGRLRDREAVPALCAALQDAPALRDAALQALGEIRDPAALPALLELLAGSGQVSEIGSRLMVLAALGRIKDPATVPALEGVLRCGILELREAAIHALGEIGGPTAVPPLAALLTDADARIAVRAAIALAQLREPAAWRALAGARAKGHLEVRVRAVRALSEIGDEAAVQALCRALRDPADAVRYEAASGLTRIASPGRTVPLQARAALPILRQQVSLLSMERPEVRAACQHGLQRIEAATAQMKHLPLPATGDEPGREQLPLPADAVPRTPGADEEVHVRG